MSKRYGQVHALQGADFTVRPGEVVALIGDNGAGKSTLVKTLSGTVRPDGGQILVAGVPVELGSPLDARRHGVETVYQDLALAPDLDAAANLHLGRELYRPGLLGRLGVLDHAAMRRSAVTAFAELGVDLRDVGVPVASLSGGQRQSVAVARAVAFANRIIFMDEPTAALGVVQRGRVLETIRRVRDRGVSVVLISHNMPEVLSVADRVEVLRLGRRVAVFEAANTSVEELVGAMTGALDPVPAEPGSAGPGATGPDLEAPGAAVPDPEAPRPVAPRSAGRPSAERPSTVGESARPTPGKDGAL
ncbi:simple sugar transport system ATP-binding protein [Kitasatospora herbaricolor]|uniref:ATP-binding cassette domain-containing protein n=1 Tax=Kitasatospora herbaricolor TaxID=68217 RepID=UPI00278DA18C|nr:ATP-binding cassette domain-containing protein [Kitasatospora herbaricolor]MDQ0306558.1 simple sugar transport system ATP-binding protein [Kitasatospora herbaricolor]